MSETHDEVIRVVAAVADKTKVILYKEDGDTLTVSQGDYRLKALMDEIVPITARGEVAVISLTKFSVYADFEKRSNGVVRFFKVARRALGSLLGSTNPNAEVVVVNMEFTPDISPDQAQNLVNQVHEYLAPWTSPGASLKGIDPDSAIGIGNQESVPSSGSSMTPPPASPTPIAPPMLVAVDFAVGPDKTAETIVERLEPVTEDDPNQDEMIVAVIGDVMIPDVDKLKPYILHAVKTNSLSAVQNFLKRVAAIIGNRVHSVIDLMRFLEKADLPLAEDGSIIAYKVLNLVRGEQGVYVDCHTGKIKQRVGSYVCVDEKLVDLNRYNECSNGLHIARRSYLKSFCGDVCVLCKIAPEDVMVVPHDDPNKVRVKGYHILAELNPASFATVKSNRPMTSDTIAQNLLLAAIQGKHIGRIEEVKIHGQKGNDVVITPLNGASGTRKKPKPAELAAEDKKKAVAFDDPQGATNTVVEPREINKRVNAEIEKSRKAQEKEVAASKTAKAKPAKTGSGNGSAKAVKTQPKSVAKIAQKSGTKSAVNPPQKAKVITSVAGPVEKDELSPEQKDVLRLMGSGVSQSETSRRTGVSRRTIDRWVKKYGTSATDL